MVLFIIGLSTMHVVVLRGNISVIFPLAGIINSNIIPSAFRTIANWRGLFNKVSPEEQRITSLVGNKVYYGTYKVYYCFFMSTSILMFGILKSARVIPIYLVHVLISLYTHLECSRKTNTSFINIASEYMEQKEQVRDLKRNRFLFQ